MDKLIKLLHNFSYDPFDSRISFDIALFYEKLNQYAAAVSFYCRSMENTEDTTLQYSCLLKIAHCFNLQKDRSTTVRSFYKRAICLLPSRPEAYFLLSKHYEYSNEYSDSYLICSQALAFCDFNQKPLISDIDYPGKYGILFQKAVAAWWWGKPKESRDLFHLIADEYYEELDETHMKAVQNNLINLGCGPESFSFRSYNKNNYNSLRFKFKDSEKIETNYSQAFQDMFVLSMLEGKRNGKYLEIGSAGPFHGSNTALLEKDFDWYGVGIEYKQDFCDQHAIHRKNKVLCVDATACNYNKILQEITNDNIVDYLQIDCEPSKTTFEILLSIPFEKYKFAVITYEHDYYVDITRQYREKSRKYLQSLGYKLVVGNVSVDGFSAFEDWWCHPDLINPEIINLMQSNQDMVSIENYFYPLI